MITDQSGNAVWQWGNLDPFGNNLPNGAGGQFVFNLRFPGQYYDAETGTHYNYFRDYDPAVGRYVESDPIGLLSRQASTYSYVNGNPLTIFDPFGLFGYPEHVSITNSAIGDDPFFPSMGVAVANVDFLPGSQDPANAYWHAMRDGTNGQTVQEAQQLFWQYLDTQISSCTWEGLARALHAAEDSAARGHRNFQPWAGGLPGLSHVEGDFAPTDSEIYIAIQTAKEVLARFKQKCPCGTHSGSAEDVAVPYGAPIF